ncbi:hypothetical protein [Pantoea sp. BAV 3049]|uniref:hypothetical protein n=1 Tax=Pantoea sp. BAV 3049 TaxID=2654188 RepID=UPI001E5F8970|nr:hypothetical protein [Pantoea sp. BAV 3049]
MSMRLVKKRAPRGRLSRQLSEAEESAVKKVCGRRETGSQEEKGLALDVLTEMRRTDTWLACSCVTGDSPPMNSANLRTDTGTLYLQAFSTPHDAGCPMFRELREDDDTTRSGTRKTSSSRPVSYRSFLPREENGARLRGGPARQDDGNDRFRRKRRPRLARLLLTLIEDAGLNVIETLTPFPTAPAREAIDRIAAVTRDNEFARGRPLSDIVRFWPLITQDEQQRLMGQLEAPDSPWPAGRARHFYQIFMSDEVSREGASFRFRNEEAIFAPEKGLRINGEGQDGLRPLYWVILEFRRSADGSIICSDGYAHALYSRGCPVPVDSGLERQTLESLATCSAWMANKEDAPVSSLSLKKPLFDYAVTVDGEEGWVLPDFVVEATTAAGEKRVFVIETMGYQDEDYIERKSRQHRGMRTLGQLQTDPPKWPEETDRTLEKQMYGILLHLK